MFRQSTLFPPSISKPETPKPPPVSTNESARRQSMPVSSAANSQPLHNFPLSDLKWAMNNSNTHRLRKPSDKSPLREADPGSEVPRRILVSEKARSGASASSSDVKLENEKGIAAGGFVGAVNLSEKKSTALDGRSKIMMRIRPKNSKEAAATNGAVLSGADAVGPAAADAEADAADQISIGGPEVEDFVPKTWNLRPRKPPPKKRSNGNSGDAVKKSGAATLENKAHGGSRPETTRPKNSADAEIAAGNKEKKQKLSISLSKMEIDEDIFALTGNKPSRRPKKRAKNVQKQLDGLYPGLWLGSITPDAYKVSDRATKG